MEKITRKKCEEIANEIQHEIKKFVIVGNIDKGFTYNKYVIISSENKSYYVTKKSERWTFKTWRDCYQFLEGMKVALHQREKYEVFDAWTKEDIYELMEDLDVQNIKVNEIAEIIDNEYENIINNIIDEILKRDKKENEKK